MTEEKNGKIEENVEIDSTERRKKILAYNELYALRMKELMSDIIYDTTNQIRKR
jgi:hypothetical protein